MAGTEVSSVIRDILDVLHNSLNVFKNSGRKHKRRHSESSKHRDNEESRAHDALALRPQEIKSVYEQSVAKHGRHFEIGDSTSQTSLAKILLVLNTGLIKLINNALSHDSKSRLESRSSILDLSQTATLDTICALSELNSRLTSVSKLNLTQPYTQAVENDDQTKTRTRSTSCSQASKRPPISTQLRRHGGWIRSRSDSSVITVVPSKRWTEQSKTPVSRSQNAAGSRSTSSQPTSRGQGSLPPPVTRTSGSRSPPPRYSQVATKTATAPLPRPKPEHLQARANRMLAEQVVAEKQPIRHPSMYIVSSDFFDNFPQSAVPRYEAQAMNSTQTAPARPPKIPHHSRPQQHPSQSQSQLDKVIEGRVVDQHSAQPLFKPSKTFEGRVRPPSMMTFMTASTKIGEIPEHRLPDRELTQQQQAEIPMPYVLPDMLAAPRRKGGRGFKFWKKDRDERGLVGTVAG